MAEISDKEKALELLNKRPANFRWTINGTTLTKDELIKEVGSESEIGISIIGLAKELGDNSSSLTLLGKRYKCLVCGTEVLTVKAGEGRASCCEQNMEIKEPKVIASSD